MATGGLYGASPNGNVVASSGSESSGLYGNSSVFGGTYFEYLIFIESATVPATPTGGSWSFTTNIGTPPTGWTNSPPASPTNPVYLSIALVNSRGNGTLTWSVPGQIFKQGPTGATGATGATGPQGPQGNPGTVATIAAGTTTTGAAGTSASVVNAGTSSAAVFNFTIPKGDTGATGPTGSTGSPGAAATVAAGTTTTGAAGTSASVINSGTSSAAVFNFTIPRGDVGATGATGSAATVAAGTTTTGAAGTSASVTNSGTSSAAVFNFTIPRGDTGATGAGVPVGGTAGQALTKIDSTNYNTQWSNVIGSVASVDGSVTVTNVSGAVDLSVAVAAATTNVICQVRNTTGATLTKGTAVYISGATGQIPTVNKALATSDATSAQTLGLMTSDLTNNTNGYVTVIGLITNIDTSAYTDGQQLYLSGTTAGTLTATKPYAPIHLVYVAVVEHAHPTQGKLFVKVQNGYELDEIHNVSAQTPTNGQTIVYNSTTSLWENNTVSLTSGINGTLPIANGGTGQTTANAAFNALVPSQTSNSGKYLTTDGTNTSWATNPLGTVTSVGGTGTVNGITLSGTVTSSGSLTLGGTLNLSSPPVIGNTTPAAITGTTITGTTFVGISGGTF